MMARALQRAPRAILIAVVAVLLVVLVVLALSAFVLMSHTGTRAALGFAVKAVDGLVISRVDGRLLGPLVLHGVEYEASSVKVALPEVRLDWRPQGLIQRELTVTQLQVTGGTIAILESDAQPGDAAFTGLVLPESLPLPLSVSLADVSFAQLSVLTGAAQITVGSLGLDAVLEAAPEVAPEVAVDAALDTASSPALGSTASLTWADLAVLGAEQGELQLGSDAGEITLFGRPVEYSLRATTVVQLPDAQRVSLAIVGEGDQRELRLEKISSKATAGEVAGNVRVNWSQGIAAWVALSGSVREQPLELDAVFTIAGGAAQVETFAGSVANTRFSATGELGDALNFQWQINSPDLGVLLPRAEGSVQSQGRLHGSRKRPSLEGTFALNSAKYEGYAAQSLTASVLVDLPANLSQAAEIAPTNVSLQAKGLRAQEVTVSEARLDLAGTLGSHTLSVAANSDVGSVTAELAGGWSDNAWSGVWQEGDIAPLALGGWKLQAPHRLTLGRAQQHIEQACWRAVQGAGEPPASGSVQGGTACYQATRAPDDTLVNFTLQNLPLAYFEPLAPQTLRMEGQIAAQGTFKQRNGGEFALNAAIDTSPATLHGDSTLIVQSLALEPGRIAVTGTAAELQTTLALPFAAGGGLDGTVVVRDVGTADTNPLSGRLEASVPDLSFLSAIHPEIEKLSGSATLSLSLAGTLQSPKPEGELAVADMQLALATPGLLLEGVTLSVTGDSSGTIAINGGAESNGGVLEIQGSGQWVSQSSTDGGGIDLQTFAAQVSGDNFGLWNTADAVLRGSPELALSLANDRLEIKGDVVIPHARITPVELPPSAVKPTGDQIIILPEEGSATAFEQRVSHTGVYADVQLRLEDDVSIDGFGFTGALEGELGITMAPGKPVLASGELNVVDGEYRAFGQGLVIERGQLLFAGGDIENPGLNIRAQRRPAADIVVGVDVTGQLQKPAVNIFSEPDMGSSNQLAWLVLGRPFENTSGAETDYISQAALLLGIQGGDYLAKSFGEKLGLDTVGIETGSGEAGAASDVNQAALVVGKYLTPRLYISYGVGLLESLSTVKLRYQINDSWNLVTQSSPIASGGDIKYTIER